MKNSIVNVIRFLFLIPVLLIMFSLFDLALYKFFNWIVSLDSFWFWFLVFGFGSTLLILIEVLPFVVGFVANYISPYKMLNIILIAIIATFSCVYKLYIGWTNYDKISELWYVLVFATITHLIIAYSFIKGAIIFNQNE